MRSPRDSSRFPKFRAYRSAALSLNNDGIVVWDAVKFDTHGLVRLGDSRLVIPAGHGGEWEIEAKLGANVALTADNYWGCYVKINGATTELTSPLVVQRGAAAALSGMLAGREVLSPGDYLELLLQTNNGTTALHVGQIYATFLSARRVG